MKIKVFLALLMIGILSCSKDDVSYPKVYTKKAFVEGEVRMFSNSGYITNYEEILDFENRIRTFHSNSPNLEDVYSFNDDIQLYDDYNFDITLQSESSGELRIYSNESGESETIGFNLINRNGYSLISIHDTIVTTWYIEDPRLKCTPQILKKEDMPAWTGTGPRYTFLVPFYIRISEEEINLCLVSYMEVKYHNGNKNLSGIQSACNNLLNENYLQEVGNLGEGWIDTIAFKQSYIVFK